MNMNKLKRQDMIKIIMTIQQKDTSFRSNDMPENCDDIVNDYWSKRLARMKKSQLITLSNTALQSKSVKNTEQHRRLYLEKYGHSDPDDDPDDDYY